MRQRIELTGTNRSIGLIALIANAHSHSKRKQWRDTDVIDLLASFVLGRPGGFSGGPVPDPISNSAVKLPSADGTKSQDLEE